MSRIWNSGGQPLIGPNLNRIPRGVLVALPQIDLRHYSPNEIRNLAAVFAATGFAPSYAGDDTPQPGWVWAASYNNGDTAQIDVGAALNNPTTWSYQVVRSDGNNATGTGNSGSHVSATSLLYTFNSADSKLQISALVTAENAFGSDSTYIASITVE